VNPALVDTDILSMYFRGNENVKNNFEKYEEEHGKVNISIITYYEVVNGLNFKDAKKQLESFLKFAPQNNILPVTERSASISAEIYARLRKASQPIDDIDLLIAGIAISNNLILATNNESHFDRIDELEIENWSRS
jgi:tRNA(fMet)-specific endonuclease VapC